MIQQVVEYFLGRGENPCSAEDGVTVMQIIEAMAVEGVHGNTALNKVKC
jgi:hypothetical protein